MIVLDALRATASPVIPRDSVGNPGGAEDDPLNLEFRQARAFRSLGDLGVEAKPPARARIVRQIIQALEAEEARFAPPNSPGDLLALQSTQIKGAALDSLLKIGKVAEEALPLYTEALKSPSETIRTAGARVAGGRGLDAKDLLSRVFQEVPVERVVGFYREVLPPEQWMRKKGDGPDPAKARQIARALSKEHPDPKVRAISLSFTIVLGGSGEDVKLDLSLLKDLYSSDPDPLVKRAAIRIAGLLGQRKDGLDLKQVMLAEKDPLLLKDAIEARSAWSSGSGWPKTVELWDGLLCYWIPGRIRKALDWEEQELEFLAKVLREEREPGLRDAASMALSERRRDKKREPMPALKVHEWGVFLDTGKTLIPPERVLADLPPFVHRSQVGPAELWAARSYTPMAVCKPVLFFYTPEPITVLLQVQFEGGMPWTYYPHATDYVENVATVPREEEDRRQVSLTQTPGLHPDWLKTSASPPLPRRRLLFDRGPKMPQSLRPFYRVAPWLQPNHPEHATEIGPGPVILTGMGLEWCGLRVGYPDALEGTPAPLPPGSWWGKLREVPCGSVAVRGERERFLFYDGATNLRSPVLAAWRDASRSTLLIRTRSFAEYPRGTAQLRVAWLRRNQEADTLSAKEGYPDTTPLPLPAVFVVSRRKGEPARGWVFEALASQVGPFEVALDSAGIPEVELRRKLAEKVLAEGLTGPETESLLGTWEKEFFLDAGLRVITLLPRWFYDAMLPIEIEPAPGELKRVGLILKDCRDLVDT